MKARLINQFLLSIYAKSAGMLPDKFLGRNNNQLAFGVWSLGLMSFLGLRFTRSGRPRKFDRPEKLAIVLESVSSPAPDHHDDDERFLEMLFVTILRIIMDRRTNQAILFEEHSNLRRLGCGEAAQAVQILEQMTGRI